MSVTAAFIRRSVNRRLQLALRNAGLGREFFATLGRAVNRQPPTQWFTVGVKDTVTTNSAGVW